MTSTLGGLTVTLGKKLTQSDDYLKGKHNLLTQFDSIDDLVTDETKLTAKDRQAIEHPAAPCGDRAHPLVERILYRSLPARRLHPSHYERWWRECAGARHRGARGRRR